MACVSAALRQIKKSRVSHSDSDFSISTHCRETAADTRIISENFNKWNVSNDVTDKSASTFNQDIGAWDTSGVTTMEEMFRSASAFNQNISGWAVHDVTWMTSIFDQASSFNQDIGAWNTSGVKNMVHMFKGAYSFNKDISAWDTSRARNMEGMFRGASAFDQDIGGWAIQGVNNMDEMFRGATSFDQDLGWCLDAGVALREAFAGTKCESTSCGVKKEAFGTCDEGAIAGIITAIVLSCILFLLAACFCCYYKKKIKKVRAVAPTTSEEAPATSEVSVVDAPAAGIAPNELGTVVSVKHKPGEVWSPPRRGGT